MFKNDLIFDLYSYLNIPVIQSPQAQNKPSYPFIGYTMITSNIALSQGNLSDKLVDGTTFEFDIESKLETPVNHTFSFTAYSDTEQEAYLKAKMAVDYFRHIVFDKEYVIVDVTSLSERSMLEVDEYEYRWGFDITVKTKDTVIRKDATIEDYSIKEE